MAKRSKKIESQTTPGHKMLPRSWVAELVMWRANRGKLPPYFWRNQKWKWKYGQEVRAATKFVKKYGEDAVVRVVCANKKLITLSSYGDIEFLLQQEEERLRRLSLPKDTTPLAEEVHEPLEDLREPRSVSRKVGLFEKLAMLEKDNNGEKEEG